MKNINGYKTRAELIKSGYKQSELNAMLRKRQIIKIKAGLYRNAILNLNNQDLIDISQAVPNAIICMFSALAYYELTTFIPKKVEISVPRISTRTNILSPKVKRYYTAKPEFNKYIKKIKYGPYSFKIYDIEKTLCDIIKNPKTNQTDIAKEAFKNYMRSDKKNISKLVQTAKDTNSYTKISSWLNILA